MSRCRRHCPPTRFHRSALPVTAAPHLTDAVDGLLSGHRVLTGDREGKWTEGFRRIMEAERFVRSIREEYRDHLILLGERRLLRVPGLGSSRSRANTWLSSPTRPCSRRRRSTPEA
jgi:hypothetical protein